MPVYAVATGRIVDQAKLDEYISKVGATVTPEMKVLAIQDNPEIVEGPAEHPRTVVLEFPSKEDFRAWYDSPVYQEILPLRLAGVSGSLVLADGFVPPEG